MTAVRLALLGAGRWGRKILRTLSGFGDVHVAAIATRSGVCQAAPPDARVESNWEGAATAADVDGVLIAAPAALHAPMARVAIEAGKAVFVEKPMTTSLADAVDLVALAERCSAVVHVDHIDLCNPAWLALRQCLPEVGRVESLEGVFGSDVPSPLATSPRWEWGPHAVALCIDLLGEPTAVTARHELLAATAQGNIEQTRVELGFPDGGVARLLVGSGFEQRHRRLVVRGRQGTLAYDDNAKEKLVVESSSGRRAVAAPGPPPLERALRRFVAAARAGARDVDDAVLGATVVRVLDRMDSSLRESPT